MAENATPNKLIMLPTAMTEASLLELAAPDAVFEAVPDLEELCPVALEPAPLPVGVAVTEPVPDVEAELDAADDPAEREAKS